MFLLLKVRRRHREGFPRIRGDVPALRIGDMTQLFVFPAYAGMFRLTAGWVAARKGFPRIRGDVPRFYSLRLL